MKKQVSGVTILRKSRINVPEGCKIRWTTYITRPDGSRLYASQRGIKAFPLIVKDED